MASISFDSYVEQLFKTAVGDLGISPSEFYGMTIREVNFAIKGKDDALMRDYNLMLIACLNANGMVHVGKKYKVINPFEVEKKVKNKKKPTKQDRDETLAFIKAWDASE